MSDFRPKDYIYTQGIYGAIVDYELEGHRILTTIRYYQDALGDVVKFNTHEANEFLQKRFSDYIFHSKKHDVLLHGIPINHLEKHFLPNQALLFLKSLPVRDIKQTQTIELLEFFINSGLESDSIGVTGSILIGFQSDKSDIDIVIYGREAFFRARELVKQAFENDFFQTLDAISWEDSYKRRNASISLEEYIFHEQRKLNKFLYNGTKVDISLVLNNDELFHEQGPFRKQSLVTIKARVIDDSKSFDLPARYYLDNSEWNEVVCYTATYIGQAQQGEMIEVSGMVEINAFGDKRIIVGTSREANDEYIKVIAYE